MIDAPRMFVHLLAAGCGPRPTPRSLRAASPLTEVHRPRARQAVDVVGAPAYDPKPPLRDLLLDHIIGLCKQGLSIK